jgi:Co/Zn/Cd efflux system component
MALAGILLMPGLATLWTAWEKFNLPVAPDPALLSLTGAGALAVNMSCALMLTRYRRHSGSLTRAAFRASTAAYTCRICSGGPSATTASPVL